MVKQYEQDNYQSYKQMEANKLQLREVRTQYDQFIRQ